jgi:dynein light chain 1
MAKGISCKDAIKLLVRLPFFPRAIFLPLTAFQEEKSGQSASEIDHAKLYFQSPPIERMDNGLAALTSCTQLSLSTNCIDRIAGLSGLNNLKILSLGRNLIKRIEGLDSVAGTLEQLWLSYNSIEKLHGLSSCKKLRVLFISNNLIASWAEIERLQDLPELQELVLIGNPLEQKHAATGDYRAQVVRRLPNLIKLEGVVVTQEDRDAAEAL